MHREQEVMRVHSKTGRGCWQNAAHMYSWCAALLLCHRLARCEYHHVMCQLWSCVVLSLLDFKAKSIRSLLLSSWREAREPGMQRSVRGA